MRLAAGLNACLRSLIRPGLRLLALLSVRHMRKRMARDAAVREALKTHLGIATDTPICGYDSKLRERVLSAVKADPAAVIVRTSGSTQEPKELLYTPRRLRRLEKAFALATARIVHALNVRRPIVFTLASTKEDDSLTSLYAWKHGKMPSRLDCWVTPHLILAHPSLQDKIAEHGLSAVRLWAILLSNPGWLYSTNPSTQALFLRQLETDWRGARSVIQAWLSEAPPSPTMQRLARRIVSPGWQSRMQACLDADSPWPVHTWWPGLELRSSWDGGSVGTFLSDVEARLPDSVRFVPMFSMSTESIETLPFFVDGTPRFLPLAPGVLVEFLPENAPDEPHLLLEPGDLKTGAHYAMVLSDSYGLIRYQTEDVFECLGMESGQPDLAFRRRRGLSWSFTGEKLTGAQLESAFSLLREDCKLGGDIALSLAPTDPPNTLPGYVLVVGHTAAPPPAIDPLVDSLERRLRAINTEYADKRDSGRLAPLRPVVIEYDRLAALLDPRASGADATAQRAWDSQFKLLPLLQRHWEELDSDDL